MRWEEGCPVPQGIHEYIGLLDIALGDPDGIVGLFAALLSGKRYLDVQLEGKDFGRVERAIERARKAGVENLDYRMMGESMKDLRDLLRDLRARAKPVTREAVQEYAKSHGPPPPRHTDHYTAFVEPRSRKRSPGGGRRSSCARRGAVDRSHPRELRHAESGPAALLASIGRMVASGGRAAAIQPAVLRNGETAKKTARPRRLLAAQPIRQ